MTPRPRMRFLSHVMRSLPTRVSLIVLAMLVPTLVSPAAYGFDSAPPVAAGGRGYSTHSKMTNMAIARLKRSYPEVNTYKHALLNGVNLELHERKVTYSDSLEALRVNIGGTNEGLRFPDNLWRAAVRAYMGKNHKAAFLYTGILLHMIQDMGVPSHAWSIYHQSAILEPLSFDNFEALSSADNWKPDKGGFIRSDPIYTKPWDYYTLSRNWTRMDTRHWHGLNKSWNKKDRDNFPKTWRGANKKARFLLSTRQYWTAKVTEWALRSAVLAFREINPPHVSTPARRPGRVHSSAPKPRKGYTAPRPRPAPRPR